MKYTLFFLGLSFFLFLNRSVAQDNMDNEQLGTILYTISDTIQGESGNWQFLVDSIPMFCVTDEYHNRMRIVSPVKTMQDVSAEELEACMEANFHTALDVKYAISDEVLWVTFIHPLRELTIEQAIDAVTQIYNANVTFGTLYSSTDLFFPKREKKKKERILKKS